DDTTFYFRFLESLTSIWWLEAAIDPTQHIGWARWQSSQTQAELSHLKMLTDKQAATIADILEIRSREIFKAQIRLLLAHFVFTVRQAIELGRTRFNQLLRRFRPNRPQLAAGGDKEKPGTAREKSAAL
ncbi:MAG TPA: hypothetical protein VHY59_04445, partial [Chthoniobacterales bacterium]|nr:hypothetical protein [Chthoniobacterales bacterium]